MMHLITVVGKSAKRLFLKPQHIADFKSVLGSITSGRVFIVSTRYRSDLFYQSDRSNSKAILKLWLFYTATTITTLARKDFKLSSGDEQVLSTYFQSINKLAKNWYYYKFYRRAFRYAVGHEAKNVIARTVSSCDQYLIEHNHNRRKPLLNVDRMTKTEDNNVGFSLAMRIIGKEDRTN